MNKGLLIIIKLIFISLIAWLVTAPTLHYILGYGARVSYNFGIRIAALVFFVAFAIEAGKNEQFEEWIEETKKFIGNFGFQEEK